MATVCLSLLVLNVHDTMFRVSIVSQALATGSSPFAVSTKSNAYLEPTKF